MSISLINLPNLAANASGYPAYLQAITYTYNKLAGAMALSPISFSSIANGQGNPVADALKLKALSDSLIPIANDLGGKTQVRFTGHSLMFGSGATNPATGSMPAQVAAMLGTSYFGDFTNKGVSGATVDDIAGTQQADLLGAINATNYVRSIAVTEIGINDFLRDTSITPPQVYAKIKTYIAKNKAAGYLQIICTNTPFNTLDPTYGSVEALNSKVRALDDLVRAGWKTDLGCAGIADFGSLPLVGYGRLNDSTYIAGDGQHLTRDGYAVEAPTLLGCIFSVARGLFYGVQAGTSSGGEPISQIPAGGLYDTLAVDNTGNYILVTSSGTTTAVQPVNFTGDNISQVNNRVRLAAIPANPAAGNFDTYIAKADQQFPTGKLAWFGWKIDNDSSQQVIAAVCALTDISGIITSMQAGCYRYGGTSTNGAATVDKGQTGNNYPGQFPIGSFARIVAEDSGALRVQVAAVGQAWVDVRVMTQGKISGGKGKIRLNFDNGTVNGGNVPELAYPQCAGCIPA